MSQSCTKTHTPLFNVPSFREDVSLDAQGLWRPLETVLFPQTPVIVKDILERDICRIETPAYPSNTPLYTDLRFLSQQPFQEWQLPKLPPLSHFLNKIDFCLKMRVPYLWGGNLPEGCTSLVSILQNALDEQMQRIYRLQGVDCSGLIYWATQGATGRNTSDLIREGTGVPIEGLSPEQIATCLKPGMIIAWKGHVLVVTEEGIVDSTPEKGVSFATTAEKLQELMQKREPINAWPLNENPAKQSFVVRNLYSEK